MKQELWQDKPDKPRLLRLREVTFKSRVTCKWSDYLFGDVTQPTVSRLNETIAQYKGF